MAPSFKKRLAETAVTAETTIEHRLEFYFNLPTLHLAPLIAEYNRPYLNDVLRQRAERKPAAPVEGAPAAPVPSPEEVEREATREAKANEERLIDVMVRFSLRGWDGLYDDDGNEVTYSAENAQILLSSIRDTHPHELVRMTFRVQDPANYTRTPKMRAEEVTETAKNS